MSTNPDSSSACLKLTLPKVVKNARVYEYKISYLIAPDSLYYWEWCKVVIQRIWLYLSVIEWMAIDGNREVGPHSYLSYDEMDSYFIPNISVLTKIEW